MFFNKKLHAKIAALESVVSKQTNTIDQLILDKRSLQRQVTDLHAQRDVLSRRVTPDSSKQFHPMGNQNAVKKTHATKADAERYRWLKDNRSYAYAMQPDSPAECGIEFQWQQCSYEERNWNIDSAIDDEISRAAIDAMKGAT